MELPIPDRPSVSLDQPRIMGILNVTPDSFSDGGRFDRVEAAVAQGLAMARAGAAIIDVGGESTRPGAERQSAAVQQQRVVPVIERLRATLDDEAQLAHVLISIDTTRRDVAEAAVEAGASMLNDVTAGRDDPGMLELAAAHGLPIALMHMQGDPATMQDNPTYADVVGEVLGFLLERAEAAERAGVVPGQIVLDPGIGFGKTVEHNLALLAHLDRFTATGHPVMLGTSRKGFIGRVSPEPATGEPGPADARVGGTCATTALAVEAGVRLLRVHDVQSNRQAAEIAWAITRARAGDER